MRDKLEPVKSKGRQRFKVWQKQADYDLQAAELSLKYGFNEWAAYQAEQAVEKSIKAVLVHSGWKPPRIHKLQILIGMANNANQEFKKTKFNFKNIESFTFISRYPFLIPGDSRSPHKLIRKTDSLNAITQAKDFLKKVSVILKNDIVRHKVEKLIDTEIFESKNIKARIAEIKEILVREFEPEKIIVFGSLAKSSMPEQPTTMDVLIIAETDLPFIERIIKARRAAKGGQPIIEPLVYTPQEFKTMVEEEGEGFLENALKTGKAVYTKN